MDEKRLDELEALAKAATEGPWIPKHLKTAYLATGEGEHEVRSMTNGMTVAYLRFRMGQGRGELGDDAADHDVAFIAAARAAVPELLAEVKRLQAVALTFEDEADRLGGEVKRLREALTEADAPGIQHGLDVRGSMLSARRAERERIAKMLANGALYLNVTLFDDGKIDTGMADLVARIRALPDEPGKEGA